MKTKLLILVLLFAGCANDKAYNISNLSLPHQASFIEAMDWWNLNHGTSFYSDDNGPSDAVYGPLDGGILASYSPFHHAPTGGDRITFNESIVVYWPETAICGLARHELGHHRELYGSYHSSDPKHPMHSYPPPCDRW